MPATKVGPSTAAQILQAPMLRWIDAAMILLALASVAFVLLDIFFRPFLYATGIFGAVVLIDLLIVLVFVADFVYENAGKSPMRMLRDSWFDILGMLPMAAFVAVEAALTGIPLWAALTGTVQLTAGASRAGGLVRLFRLVRIVRIVQAFARFLRATNMTFGEQVTKRVFDKYRRIIVAELTTPIMVAGITLTQEIVIRMKFLESVGNAVDAKRPEIHAAVLEAMQKAHVPRDLVTRPFVDKLVKDIEDGVVTIVVSTLTGPQLNKLTQEMIVEVMDNFKKQLQSPEGKAILREMGAAPPSA